MNIGCETKHGSRVLEGERRGSFTPEEGMLAESWL